MRGRPPSGGTIRGGVGALSACLLALAGVCLGAPRPTPAHADPCPNAALRSGPSERLPDCRAYERVSPAEKSGFDAVTLQPLQPLVSAQSGECASEACAIAYMNVAGSFAGAPGNEVVNAYLGTRGAEGWSTTALTPPTPQAPAASSFSQVGYAFSEDLSRFVVRVPLQQLTNNAPAGVYNLFLGEPGGGYSLLTAAAPAQPPEAGCGRCFESEDVPLFAGASADFAHVIFEDDASLVEGAPGGGVESLYEAAGGRVRLVGVLPDGTVAPRGASAGGGIDVLDGQTGELEHAVSSDGARIVFQAASDGGPAYAGGPSEPAQAGSTQLYDRIDGEATVELSAPGPGAEPSSCETPEGDCEARPARYWDASADGSLVYFTSAAALTRDSYVGAQGGDLYRYDLATRTLTDVIAGADPEAGAAGASVLGVVGASEDGSYVYFVADGALAPGALGGSPNLYVWHGGGEQSGAIAYIATLRAPDAPAEEEEGGEEEAEIEEELAGVDFHSDLADWTSRPVESQAYVTPDGRHLAFMSVEPLTGYDNRDQATGEADHEVFEYSAATGRLVCASCDPGGARPLGSAFVGAKLTERLSTPFHQPRSLSDDGARLFFSSPDPLAPGLSGEEPRLFEYEDGAVAPISGAEPGGTAVFLDASASGDDVFLATREQLVPGDRDELVDVYDARVDGGFAEAPAPAPCAGSECRESLLAPPSFPTPASASYIGAGNPPAPIAHKPTRRQLLARALARCRKVRARKRRAACEAAARRRYGRHGAKRAGKAKHRRKRR